MRDDLSPLRPLTERRGALLGLDLGARTIGVAACDALWSLATPLTTIRRTTFTPDAGAVLKLAAGRSVVGLVIGLPYNMDGTEGPRAQSARAFARNLARLTPLPIGLFDERLSSFSAGERMREAGVSRRLREERIDANAAAEILEGALAALVAAP